MTEANLKLSAEADARNAKQQLASMEQRAMGLEANNNDLKNELEEQKQELTKLYRADEKAADLYEGMETMCKNNADLVSKLRVANKSEGKLRNELGAVSNALESLLKEIEGKYTIAASDSLYFKVVDACMNATDIVSEGPLQARNPPGAE